MPPASRIESDLLAAFTNTIGIRLDSCDNLLDCIGASGVFLLEVLVQRGNLVVDFFLHGKDTILGTIEEQVTVL